MKNEEAETGDTDYRVGEPAHAAISIYWQVIYFYSIRNMSWMYQKKKGLDPITYFSVLRKNLHLSRSQPWTTAGASTTGPHHMIFGCHNRQKTNFRIHS